MECEWVEQGPDQDLVVSRRPWQFAQAWINTTRPIGVLQRIVCQTHDYSDWIFAATHEFCLRGAILRARYETRAGRVFALNLSIPGGLTVCLETRN